MDPFLAFALILLIAGIILLFLGSWLYIGDTISRTLSISVLILGIIGVILGIMFFVFSLLGGREPDDNEDIEMKPVPYAYGQTKVKVL